MRMLKGGKLYRSGKVEIMLETGLKLIFLSSLIRISSIEVLTSIEEIRVNDERKINIKII